MESQEVGWTSQDIEMEDSQPVIEPIDATAKTDDDESQTSTGDSPLRQSSTKEATLEDKLARLTGLLSSPEVLHSTDLREYMSAWMEKMHCERQRDNLIWKGTTDKVEKFHNADKEWVQKGHLVIANKVDEIEDTFVDWCNKLNDAFHDIEVRGTTLEAECKSLNKTIQNELTKLDQSTVDQLSSDMKSLKEDFATAIRQLPETIKKSIRDSLLEIQVSNMTKSNQQRATSSPKISKPDEKTPVQSPEKVEEDVESPEESSPSPRVGKLKHPHIKCEVCEKKGHSAPMCRTFRKTVDKRRILKSKGICLACLNPKHTKDQDCPEEDTPCRRCKNTGHMTFLCLTAPIRMTI